MSRWNAYLNTTIRIIQEYDGNVPLSNWLKEYFREHKQMGSKDRKMVSELLYGFYRLGHSTVGTSLEERILLGIFLCQHTPSPVLDFFRPEWNANIHLTADEKVDYYRSRPKGESSLELQNIFPWKEKLSPGIDADHFNRSFLQQPDLFLRIRPGKEEVVTGKLHAAGISFEKSGINCVALANATNIASIINPDQDAVVQDYSSQRVGNYMPLQDGLPIRVWDCCAASGGKSIMAMDINPRIHLTVSDVRKSILINLQQRFSVAGIKNYQAFITDLSTANSKVPVRPFDVILADLPCTGSGTWSRTPERLYFFKEAEIEHYSQLQKKIVGNVIKVLKDGGILVYITCSVFEKENEGIVEFILQEHQLQLVQSTVLKGYDHKADSMFVAVFKKSRAVSGVQTL